MTQPFTLFVTNRNPSLADTIRVDGQPFDLTGGTVKLQMRAEGSQTLKVDTAAVVVLAAAGTVRYDWAAADVDTAGKFLAWWRFTIGGKTQDTAEFPVVLLSHADDITTDYVTTEELKATLTLSSLSFADPDIDLAIAAASRGIDGATDRRFYPDADAAQIRYYTPRARTMLQIDDLIEVTAFATDPGGDMTFTELWTENTHYVLEPLNAVANGQPRNRIVVHPLTTLWLPAYPRSARVIGKFGWVAAPTPIKEATNILAAKLLRRAREAPFGVISAGLDVGVATRIARTDPDVAFLIRPYQRAWAE